MIVLLPIVFSILLTFGFITSVIIGKWFQRRHNFKVIYFIAALLAIAAFVLGAESLEFTSDLLGYSTVHEQFVGRVLAISAAIPAIIALAGTIFLIGSTIYRQLHHRQVTETRIRELV